MHDKSCLKHDYIRYTWLTGLALKSDACCLMRSRHVLLNAQLISYVRILASELQQYQKPKNIPNCDLKTKVFNQTAIFVHRYTPLSAR